MEILTYDPSANAARLRRHPWLAVVRTWWIVWGCCRVALMAWISRWRWLPHRKSEIEREIARARFLVSRLILLGPTFVKVGQALSTRPDLVPLTYVRELAKLQDRVPAFDTRIAIETIEKELGKRISELFLEFDPEPISAASIGQVYRAHTKEGDRVVVKVQRPNLPWILSIDLALLRLFAMALQALVRREKRQVRPRGRFAMFAKDMPYVAIVDQFGRSLFDQTDFVLEGHNADRFRQNFANFADVRSPQVYWSYTSRRVLTLERIDGVKFNDLEGIQKMGVDFRKVVQLGVRAFIKQLLEDGFFHADTHPGNILVTPQGEVVYIDWGMTDTFTRETQLKLVDLFLHLVQAEYDLFVEVLVELEMFPQDLDRSLLIPVVTDIYDSQLGKKGRRLSMAEILDRVSDVLYRYPFRLPERFSFLMRTVSTMEGVVLGIWPSFRFLDVGMPYAAKLLLTVRDPSIRQRLVNDLVRDGRLDLGRLLQTVKLAEGEQSFAAGEFLPAAVSWILSPEGEVLLDAVTEALLSDDPRQAALLESLVGLDISLEDLDPRELVETVEAWLESEPGVRWLHDVLVRLGRRPLPAQGGETIARVLEKLAGPGRLEYGAGLRAQDGLLGVLDASERLIGLHGKNLQPAIDWLAHGLPHARVAIGRLGHAVARSYDSAEGSQLALRLVDLGLLALEADLELKGLVEAIVGLLLSAEGEAWREIAVEVALNGRARSRMLGLGLALASRDGVGLDLLAGAAWAAVLAMLPQGRSMRRRALDVMRRRLWGST